MLSFLFGGKRERPTVSPEAEAIFRKLDDFLRDEAAQIDRLPAVVQQKIRANAACDEVAAGTGPFGRSITNPVPVNGPLGEALYLSSLRVNRNPILFHRIGSYSEIDVFETVSIDGAVWDVVFLSLYYPRRSRRPPDGYTLQQDPPRVWYGTTSRVQPFPHNLYRPVRNFSLRMLGIPLPNPQIREALANRSFVPPAVHSRLIDELARTRITLALTDDDVEKL